MLDVACFVPKLLVDGLTLLTRVYKGDRLLFFDKG